jgi:hypothetical protein
MHLRQMIAVKVFQVSKLLAQCINIIAELKLGGVIVYYTHNYGRWFNE